MLNKIIVLLQIKRLCRDKFVLILLIWSLYLFLVALYHRPLGHGIRYLYHFFCSVVYFHILLLFFVDLKVSANWPCYLPFGAINWLTCLSILVGAITIWVFGSSQTLFQSKGSELNPLWIPINIIISCINSTLAFSVQYFF